MVPNPTVLNASYSLSLALAVLSVLHLYWALGGTWGLAAALGRDQVDASGGLRVAAGFVAFGLLVAGAVVLGRVGLWGRFLPRLLFSWGSWDIVAVLVLAALLNFTAETWTERLVFAPSALTLGALALGVARSARPPL